MVGEKPGSGDAEDNRAWMPPAPAVPPSADSLEGYTDLVEIGRGGDSIVYRARQESLNRDVAIKVLLVGDDDTVARFARELEITVDLGRQHPNIMTVLATGTTASGRPAIVMDHYERGSLDQRLRENGPLPAAEVVSIGCVLADALQFAHEHGVLHRDVKPQNVMILPTSYVLGDFGIARLADSEHTASAERFTVRHASPQILDGLPPTAADDVWSLGSTLFTLLDGRTPFASSEPGDDTALAYLRRARTEPHRPLDASGSNAGLAAVIDRALAKDPAQRWPDVASMRSALEDLRGSFLRAWSPEAADRAATPPVTDRAASPEAAVSGSSGDPTPEPVRGADSAAATDSAWSPAREDSRAAAGPAEPPVSEPVDSRDQPSASAPPRDAVPEPAPVALSVLAHEAAAPEVDAEPTGVVPRERPSDPVAPVEGDGEASEGDGKRSGGRIVLALGAVALAVGVTLGALGGILRNDDEPSGQPDDQTTSTGIRSLDAPPPETGDSQPIQIDDAIKPVITSMTMNGSSVDLTWKDRSGGEAEFVISQTLPVKTFLDNVSAGTTEYTVEGISPNAERLCFVVIAVGVDGGRAVSEPFCRTSDQ